MGDLLPVMGSLTRPLGLDDDDAVGAAHAVQRRLGGLLQHLDRVDVVGLTPVRYPLGPGSIATPSSTYNGVLPLLMDEPPRMRTAKPPSGVRVPSTPGKRPISICSPDCPGALP